MSVEDDIMKWEGFVPHLYLDHLGNPTCGVGFLVRSAEALRELFPGQYEAATNDYRYLRVMAAEGYHNRPASAYSNHTKAHMSREVAIRVLRDKISNIRQGMASWSVTLPNFAVLPVPAQDALLDMAYNLGTVGLAKKFPKMLGHLRDGDFLGAAAECRRSTSRDERNEWTRRKFLEAGGFEYMTAEKKPTKGKKKGKGKC